MPIINSDISQHNQSENSMYEEANSLFRKSINGIAIGRIEEMDPTKRLATVKTFMGPTELSDRDIPDCMLVFPDANTQGDEFVSMPRKGTIGMVFFVGGEAFFFGGIKPWNATEGDPSESDEGTYLGTEVETLEQGDKLIGTRRGNHISVKANGNINVVSVLNLLQRTYYPVGKIMRDICDTYIRSWKGGEKTQTTLDPIIQTALDYEENRRDFYRTFVMVTEKGAIGVDGIYRRTMGGGLPAIPGVAIPVYEETLSVTGNKKMQIAPGGLPTVSVEYGFEGSAKVTIGALQNFVAEVGPTGEFSIDVNKLLNISGSALGDIEVKGPIGSVSMDKTGNIEASNAVGSLALSDKGDFGVGNAVGTLLMDASGNFELAGATHTMSMNNGDILIQEAVGGALSLSKGKVALAAAAGELMETLIEIMGELDGLITAMQSEDHIGNMGFPTAPPTNVADYISSQVNLKKLSATLELMKGSV